MPQLEVFFDSGVPSCQLRQLHQRRQRFCLDCFRFLTSVFILHLQSVQKIVFVVSRETTATTSASSTTSDLCCCCVNCFRFLVPAESLAPSTSSTDLKYLCSLADIIICVGLVRTSTSTITGFDAVFCCTHRIAVCSISCFQYFVVLRQCHHLCRDISVNSIFPVTSDGEKK